MQSIFVWICAIGGERDGLLKTGREDYVMSCGFERWDEMMRA
jgi:hypothetical protein